LLLLVLTVSCLSTMFISPSTTMLNSNMKVLSPSMLQFCKVPRDAAQDCRKAVYNKDKQACTVVDRVLVNCENVVKRAFRHVNLGGCPFHIRALTLCEDEWCHQDPKSCAVECLGVREALSTCIQQHVTNYFFTNGMMPDGNPTA
jgi:hypothetical protein